MSKERLAGAIKVGFARGRVNYTETVYDELICLETEGESRHAALGKYYVKSTVFDDRVLTHVCFPVKGTAASYLQLLDLMNRMTLASENIDVHHIDTETCEISVVSETNALSVLGDFEDWMALAFARQILMFDKFAPGILAVIEDRMTGAEAYLACMQDGEEPSEDPPPEPVVIDVIEHKFDKPRDAESDVRRRKRRGRWGARRAGRTFAPSKCTADICVLLRREARRKRAPVKRGGNVRAGNVGAR